MDIICRECKHITHIPARPGINEDTYVVKEILHYKDNVTKPNLRLITNLKRSFYITKKHFQRHKQKKESEELSKLNKYYSTETNLVRNIASRLGERYIGAKSLRDVVDSPYLYGIDINIKALIKKKYVEKYPKCSTPNSVAALDIENDVVTEEITIISLVMYDKIYTVITQPFLDKRSIRNPKEQLDYLFNKYVPDSDIKNNAVREVDVVENEMEAIKAILKKSHEWKPDFIAIWNITYDINFILKVCKKYGVDPKDIFSDPNIPKNLRYFKFVEGMKQKLTESGKYTPINVEEQWHYIETPSYSYWIDAMSAHRYIRVGGKTVSGGYSLDNILEQELGNEFKKLKFEENIKYKGVEWHKYMSDNKPLEYVIYNIWDCAAMITLDRKTKDLSHVLPLLADISPYDIFNSGPKKIVNSMHFFYLERGRVLGTKPSRVNDDKILGLDNWIVLLPYQNISDLGMKVLEEYPDLRTNIRAYAFDADIVSSYPSCTIACNVSRETTLRELRNIDGIDKDLFKLQNINLMSGDVNASQYCVNMYNYPTILELEDTVLKILKKNK